MVNTLSGTSDEATAAKRFMIKFHLLIAHYLQSIDMVRWYAVYKNGGVYNKGSYYQTLNEIKKYLDQRAEVMR